MLTAQDKHDLCYQKVVRASGNLAQSMIWEMFCYYFFMNTFQMRNLPGRSDQPTHGFNPNNFTRLLSCFGPAKSCNFISTLTGHCPDVQPVLYICGFVLLRVTKEVDWLNRSLNKRKIERRTLNCAVEIWNLKFGIFEIFLSERVFQKIFNFQIFCCDI